MMSVPSGRYKEAASTWTWCVKLQLLVSVTQPPGVGLLPSLLPSPISGLCCSGGLGSAGSRVCPSPGLRFCFALPRVFLASPSSPSWSPCKQPSSSADPFLRPRMSLLPCWLAWGSHAPHIRAPAVLPPPKSWRGGEWPLRVGPLTCFSAASVTRKGEKHCLPPFLEWEGAPTSL